MSGTFFTDEARTKIVEAVQAVESKSSAEIVVSVRARSDDYRELDLLAGLALAIVTLALVMYHPAELDENLMPVETLVAFAIGSVLVAKVGPLKRALISKKKRGERTLQAARANFVEAGISRTRDRSGILLYVSELERVVQVVPDVGIDTDKLGASWKERVAGLERAAAELDVNAFVQAMTALGPVLGETYPRKEDDVNELPDAPLVGTAS
jgi:putative membrane protein